MYLIKLKKNMENNEEDPISWFSLKALEKLIYCGCLNGCIIPIFFPKKDLLLDGIAVIIKYYLGMRLDMVAGGQ